MGAAVAGQGGGTTSVWLPVSAARAYAPLGNGDRAVAAIRAAEDAWDARRSRAVDELGGICTFNPGANVLAWLPGEAVALSGRATAAHQDRSDQAWAFGDEAGSRRPWRSPS